ncbi:MAG: HAMP domain-containing histidine kinase [Lawsonibacter sp.]|nr:HAMP domain-containing histidine kinase [Lawsonibacter sp.]
MLPWLICGGLAAIVIALLVKLWLLQRSLDEIARQLGERLTQDTNSPIFLSTRDAHARRLAAELNIHLKELRRQRQRFQQGDTELKNAVTNIAHDLRTPLTAIRGYLDLLEREELSPNTRRYLDSIQNRMEAMTRLTEELFRYSLAADQPALRLEAVDLRRCLEESLVSLYASLTQRGIVPEISLPPEAVVRSLDPSAVGRIFGNIISNALKYSGGDFSAALDGDGTATFSNAAPSLDPVTTAQLFDRFYTVETGQGSTGLGLSIARLLTERMGGTIRADYQAGRLYIMVSFPK